MSTPIAITGNVGQVELRFTPAGAPVLNGSVAVNRRRFNKQTNTWEDAGTDWHRFALWGERGEAAAEVITKGTRVVVIGQLESRDFEKDGQKRTAWEIRADEIGIIAKPTRGSAPAARKDDPWATTAPTATGQDQPPW